MSLARSSAGNIVAHKRTHVWIPGLSVAVFVLKPKEDSPSVSSLGSLTVYSSVMYNNG